MRLLGLKAIYRKPRTTVANPEHRGVRPVSFAQNLPYTADDVTTGFDEYPRFPYETLYDNGGDCEDTSILVSAMLRELRYGVALLHFPGHMAVRLRVPSRRRSALLPARRKALLLSGNTRRRPGVGTKRNSKGV